MPRFRSAGQLDDPLVSVGDRAFLRLNQRLEPWQLEAGEVTVSENGRMDRGVWQPRRGITNLSGVLQIAGDPLFLPFFLADTAGGLTISTAERVDDVVTVTLSGAHGFDVAATGYVGIESLTGTVDPNGVQFITVTGADEFTFSITGATGSETYGGTGKVRSVIDDTAAAEILGSCLYSDPSSANLESILIAATGTCYQVSVADGTVTGIAYPAGAVVTGAADLVQAFDRVFLFRDGERTMEWFPLKREVTAAARATNVVTFTVPAHGLTAGDSVTVAGVGFTGDDPNGTFTVVSVPSADTFTVSSTGSDETFTVSAAALLTSAFTYVRGGVYSQPQVFQVTGASCAVSDGLVTMTVSGNTTIREGDEVTIYQTDSDDWLELLGRKFVVTSATASAVQFYAPVRDLATIGADTVDFGRNVSVGGGFSHMPAPPFGIYHQRRFIVPYRYACGGTAASPTYSARDVRDEVLISDILDPDTFDVITNQFRITAGIADFLVGFWPFYEDILIVFNRNSIHGLFGLSGSLSDTSVRELTRELGCVARKSIAQHGKDIVFLSDDGVYGVSFVDEYNLRGIDVALSESIQPLIDRINPNLASGAVGVYFANRYYLAVPLDSSRGAGDATGNNAILVYNFLNSGWESVDSVGSARWDVLNFHIARSGDRNDLYAVNANGGVHRLEHTDSDADEISVDPAGSLQVISVPWRFATRQYDAETPERKRWTRVQAQVEASGIAADGAMTLFTEDPDSGVSLGSISDRLTGLDVLPADEDASVRVRTGGKRGHGAIFQVAAGFGRPRIKAVAIEGTATNRSTISQT